MSRSPCRIVAAVVLPRQVLDLSCRVPLKITIKLLSVSSDFTLSVVAQVTTPLRMQLMGLTHPVVLVRAARPAINQMSGSASVAPKGGTVLVESPTATPVRSIAALRVLLLPVSICLPACLPACRALPSPMSLSLPLVCGVDMPSQMPVYLFPSRRCNHTKHEFIADAPTQIPGLDDFSWFTFTSMVRCVGGQVRKQFGPG
jgi:hypothetical protein